jgi:EmrB/QacA subfamily drug resistance transporter
MGRMTATSTFLGIPGRWLFFGVAALSLMMFSIDSTIVAVALPTMMNDLHTSLAWVGWTLTAYALAQTVMMPLAGKLAENFGRMRVFIGCVVVFTIGSLLCGVAPNVYLLIFFRVVQALGGGGLMPSAVGIIAEEFPDTRARMVGLFMSVFPVGGIIGPNLGGFIVQNWSWRECFLVNVPIGVVVMLDLIRRLRRRPEKSTRRPLDVIGTALFAIAIVALLCALTFLGEDPSYWRTAPFWALIVTSVAFLAGFIWYERRAEDPILDPTLVVRNPFFAVNLYSFMFGACVFGFFSFIPYYAQVQYGFSPIESGAVLTPRSIAMMLTATISSFLLLRFGYRRPMIAGLAIVVVTLFILSRGVGALDVGPVHLSEFVVLAIPVALGGIGLGLSGPASNNAALDLVPGRAASITGIRGLFRSTGGVLGTALIVLVLELSPDKAAGMRSIFFVLAIGLALTIPIVFLIPDSAREKLQRERAAAVPLAAEAAGGE